MQNDVLIQDATEKTVAITENVVFGVFFLKNLKTFFQNKVNIMRVNLLDFN